MATAKQFVTDAKQVSKVSTLFGTMGEDSSDELFGDTRGLWASSTSFLLSETRDSVAILSLFLWFPVRSMVPGLLLVSFKSWAASTHTRRQIMNIYVL